MTVGQLINLLEEAGPDTEVRVAYQPIYPLRGGLAAVAYPDDTVGNFLWLGVGGPPYDENAPSEVWDSQL